ncbi:MAG: Hsp20/alpha crystallin family protein [Halofilum sp. (in: g-proteobacteria)]|nr:Hsp20/alpha crystallin family protein [Halofilum sp. (in: g-proteobacteria)]
MATKKEEAQESGEVPVRGGGLASLRDDVNRLFDRFGGVHWPHWGRRRGVVESPWDWDPFAGFEWPAARGGERELGRADLSETDTAYELQIDLPGMRKEDIKVDLSDGILTVSGERSDEREDERKGYYLSERSYGSVRRSFRVPDSVKADDIKAEFKDGVLVLTMPKTEEAQKSARTIEVE